MKFKFYFINSFLIGLICIQTSCFSDQSESLKSDPILNDISNPMPGGELKLVEKEFYRSIFPYSIEESVGYKITSQIHNGLLRMNPKNLAIEPNIAKSWEINDEQTRYTFHLRDDVYFHDNSCFESSKSAKLTAHDVVFSMELICGEYYNSGYNLLMKNLIGAHDFYNNKCDSISGIRAIDDTTLVLELSEPAPTIIYLLASTKASIISKVAYEMYGRDLTTGCGPFLLHQINEDSTTITLHKNPNHFLTDDQGNSLPYLNSVSFKIIRDENSRTEMFLNKESMVLSEISENKVKNLFESYHKEFDDKIFIVDRKPVMATDCYEFNLSKKPFDNVNVRKAFAHAINKEKLIRNVLDGQGTIGDKGIVPKVNILKNYNYDTIKGYGYDAELAKSYLAKAGYPDGENFPEVVLELTFGHPLQEKVAIEVQNQLKNTLNISITIEEEKMSTLIDRAASGRSQMNHFTWLAEYPSPMDFLNVFYGGLENKDNASYSWPNTTRYRNDNYDKILEQALITSDKEERFKLYEKAESILMDDVPVIILWYPEVYNIRYGNIHNLFFNEMLHFDFSTTYLTK